VLSLEQAARLLGQLPPLPKTMVGVALLTGLRRGELFGLRWQDVDLIEKVVSIEQAVYEGRFGPPKTRAGERRLPLSDPAHALLVSWRAGRRLSKGELVFPTRTGKPISPNNVLRRWVFPACETLGLPRATWLTFRRTYASWSHDLGVPTKVTAELMGHARVDVTLSAYTQTLAGAHAAAAECIGNTLFADCSQTGVGGDDRPGLTH